MCLLHMINDNAMTKKNELILWKLSFIWINILNDRGMKFELNSIQKKGEMQICEQAIWKKMLMTFVINDYGVGKSKTTSKHSLSIPFGFQTEIYFSRMKQLPSET